ncbi:MAG: hypothetical protein QJR01_01880 [Kyrpidia sp.]|nr:hypothetical protein [Kyrpidia sp.]
MTDQPQSPSFYYMGPPVPGAAQPGFRNEIRDAVTGPETPGYPTAPSETRQFPVPGPWIGAGIFLPPIVVPPFAPVPFLWI